MKRYVSVIDKWILFKYFIVFGLLVIYFNKSEEQDYSWENRSKVRDEKRDTGNIWWSEAWSRADKVVSLTPWDNDYLYWELMDWTESELIQYKVNTSTGLETVTFRMTQGRNRRSTRLSHELHQQSTNGRQDSK